MSPKISLPPGVHRILSRGREYFYYQKGRGTKHAGDRVTLPNDLQSPAFWVAVRQAQGIVGPIPTDTVNALVDAYVTGWPSLPRKLAPSTQAHYLWHLRVVREAWATFPPNSCAPRMCKP